jgi:divalent metal cation (Fe/Co/Zn/Cd) transporter
LQADALNFATDIWSSAVVILGLGFVWAGRHYHIPWLVKADPISALCVAAIVASVSGRLARETLDALLDAAPGGIRNRIISQVGSVPGVLAVERVRIRKAGSRYFADVAVALARNLTFQASDVVATEVRQRVHNLLGDSDVLVNAVPRELLSESTFDRIRAASLRNNLMVHDISVQDLDGEIHVELHVELDETMLLLAAHDRVTLLEADIRAHVPEITSILTHIESEPATIETSEGIFQDPDWESKLKAIGAEFPEVVDVHEIIFKRMRGHIYLSCHVTMHDDLPLARVHDVQTALEARFKLEVPRLFRVLIHPEPQTDNRR